MQKILVAISLLLKEKNNKFVALKPIFSRYEIVMQFSHNPLWKANKTFSKGQKNVMDHPGRGKCRRGTGFISVVGS